MGAQDVLVAGMLCQGKGGGLLRANDQLHQASVVAQVDKNQATMVAPCMYPAGHSDGLAGVIRRLVGKYSLCHIC